MTLQKAIEILRLSKAEECTGCTDDLAIADQMGIEALKRRQGMRGYKTLIGLASSVPGRPLPSEEEASVCLNSQAK